jgi:uncharacterized DUF497 family protein
LQTNLQFSWDERKAARNMEKHQVGFEEAKTIFDDPMFISFIDDEHSLDEERYITIGFSNLGRLLMVAHTEREGQIRIISARKATKREEQYYATAD